MKFSVEGLSTAVLESAARSRVVPLEKKEDMALQILKRLVKQDRSAGIPFLAPTEDVNFEERLNKSGTDTTLGDGEQLFQPGSFSIEMPVEEQLYEPGTVSIVLPEEEDSDTGTADFQNALKSLQEVEERSEPQWDSFAVTDEPEEPQWDSFAAPDESEEPVRSDDIPTVDWDNIPEEPSDEPVRSDDIPTVDWDNVPKESPKKTNTSKELSFDSIIKKARRKPTSRKRASTLEEFLRENGSCNVKEAMKYFSAKEIQTKINTGKVFSRNGILSI